MCMKTVSLLQTRASSRDAIESKRVWRQYILTLLHFNFLSCPSLSYLATFMEYLRSMIIDIDGYLPIQIHKPTGKEQ